MGINRREFLSIVGATAGVVATKGFAATKQDSTKSKKPNVLIVLVDQLRSQALGCYGNKFVKTPNIDRLASGGFRFENMYSNNPVCVPARSVLLSGQYSRTCVGSRWNEMENPCFGRNDRKKFPEKTLPEAMKKLGYTTAEIGKWHVDTRPSKLGFDYSLVTYYGITENETKKHPKPPTFTEDYQLKIFDEYLTEQEDSTKPFFMYYSIMPPHMPILEVPYKYSRMYDPAKVPLRENVWKDGKLASDENWFQIYMWQKSTTPENQPITAKVTPDFTVKDLTALYYGAVSWVDDIIGQIIEMLKKHSLEEDTIVIFAADHGDMLGSQHHWNKERLYDESICVPLIYYCPKRIPNGENTKQVTSLIDIMPTILDICGADKPKHIQGRSVASLIENGSSDECFENNYAIIETPFGDIGIRTPEYLYGVRLNKEDTQIQEGERLFYDMKNDPYQMDNMANANRQRDKAKELRQILVEWDCNTSRLKNLEFVPFYK